MRHIDFAAQALLHHVGLPASAANVLPVDDGKTQLLRLWVDKDYLFRVPAIESFDGFRVSIEERPLAIA